MSGSLTRSSRKNIPGIPGACTTLKFTYLARGPWHLYASVRCKPPSGERFCGDNPFLVKWVLAECLTLSPPLSVAKCVSGFRGHAFETMLHQMNQFVHNWILLCSQGRYICYHVYSIETISLNGRWDLPRDSPFNGIVSVGAWKGASRHLSSKR